MWRRFSKGEENVFPRGTTPLRDVFCLLKSIRLWGPEDRIYETHAVQYWTESLELDGDRDVPFEIELFYRKNENKRAEIVTRLSGIVESMQGHIINECLIPEIAYHALKVSLPRNQIQNLVSKYDEIELAKVDDIMFFRPICQSMFSNENSTLLVEDTEITDATMDENAVIAVLDGMPMQNHRLLKDKLIIDDPDDFGTNYQVKDRKHGTAMASLILASDNLIFAEVKITVTKLLNDIMVEIECEKQLYIGYKTKATAKAHVHSILQKLCATSRTQATVMAMKEGLV